MESRTLRVLVVDDEDLCRWACRQLVLRLGHEAEEAASAEAALQKVDLWHPDALLLDIGLPGMNGIEALATLRGRRPMVRTILMTAHATLETAVAAIRAGAVDYLTKPLDPRDLQAALARVNIRSPGRCPEGMAPRAA